MVCKQGNDTGKGAGEQGLHRGTGCQRQQQPRVWGAGQTREPRGTARPDSSGSTPPSQSEPGLCSQPSLQAGLQPNASLLGERGTISGEAWSTRIWESGALSPAFGGRKMCCGARRGEARRGDAPGSAGSGAQNRDAQAGVQVLGARAGARRLEHSS